ncbi:hypothetical protein [Actinoplanes sp. NPDC049118]|uniref:hypothetical protein n=1 Tax=Actinoplanes sp. NPDC049118 TaxID=3155769 RepID=UPI0033D017BC
MVEPAAPPRRIELPLPEARTRLTQIVRLTPLSGQITVITDAGRPVAAIVPITAVPSTTPAGSAANSEAAAAGWIRRIEQVRTAARRQHAMRIATLERALADVWVVVDRLLPRGSDRAVDGLRIAHHEVLSTPRLTADPPARDSAERSGSDHPR